MYVNSISKVQLKKVKLCGIKWYLLTLRILLS